MAGAVKGDYLRLRLGFAVVLRLGAGFFARDFFAVVRRVFRARGAVSSPMPRMPIELGPGEASHVKTWVSKMSRALSLLPASIWRTASSLGAIYTPSPVCQFTQQARAYPLFRPEPKSALAQVSKSRQCWYKACRIQRAAVKRKTPDDIQPKPQICTGPARGASSGNPSALSPSCPASSSRSAALSEFCSPSL